MFEVVIVLLKVQQKSTADRLAPRW